MKYFTPELFTRCQDVSKREATLSTMEEWERAVQRYRTDLQKIRPHLTKALSRLLDGYHLHDAAVLALGQSEDTFLIVLQLDLPSRDLLQLSYCLRGNPRLDRTALPAPHHSRQALWLYDEVGMEPSIWLNDPKTFTHEILLSNGWELNLRFLDVDVRRLDAWYPVPRGAGLAPAPGTSLPAE